MPDEDDQLPIWQRSMPFRLRRGEAIEIGAAFRIVPHPDDWADIRLAPADGSASDITADAYEFRTRLDLSGQVIEVSAGGLGLMVDRDGAWDVHVRIDATEITITITATTGTSHTGFASRPYTGDIHAMSMRLRMLHGEEIDMTTTVLGLERARPTESEQALIEIAREQDQPLFACATYRITAGWVEDDAYGDPPAYAPHPRLIISPTRLVETFAWHPTPWRDMNRVTCRTWTWEPRAEIDELTMVTTGHSTIDAAYRVALDIFTSCRNGEFARPGEEALWAAGQFQGPGMGFGVWVRDTAHVGIRMGNLLDPEGARRTLVHTTQHGHDNGVDGVAMPMIGLWDLFQATGDLEPIRQCWRQLTDRADALEQAFDPGRGLIPAAHSTSNDAFPEPECGGFSLATEIYDARALAHMRAAGRLLGEDPARTDRWGRCADALVRSIREQYWNPQVGHFTSGPIGSPAYEQGAWETAGVEASIWPAFGIATAEQRRSTLDALPRVAMSDYGVDVFPYREEVNHFCGAAWVSWTVGLAAAANADCRVDLLERLIFQQVRNAVINKTFFEAIDIASGRAWRWPGQLWHASGFISLFTFGLLGLDYSAGHLRLHPVIPEAFGQMQVRGLRYRAATFDIDVQGSGTGGDILLDGQRIVTIPAGLTGHHRITIRPHCA